MNSIKNKLLNSLFLNRVVAFVFIFSLLMFNFDIGNLRAQLAPNPNPSGNLIQIGDLDVEFIDADYTNDGIITNEGAFNNESAGMVINRGQFDNIADGNINNEFGSTLEINAGSLTNGAFGAPSAPNGVIDNYGLIDIKDTVGSTLTNNLYGVITVYDGGEILISGIFDNHGTLTNKLGGTITQDGPGFNFDPGTFINQGTFNLLSGAFTIGNGEVFDVLAGSSFNNSSPDFLNDGTLNIKSGVPGGIFTNNLVNGVVTNNGDINVESDSTFQNDGTLNSSDGSSLNVFGTFNNTSNNSYNNAGTATVDGSGMPALYDNTGTFNNQATGIVDIINGGDFINNTTGTFNNDNQLNLISGQLTNFAGGVVNNNATGVISIASDGQYSNFGTTNQLSGSVMTVDGFLANDFGGILNNNLGATININSDGGAINGSTINNDGVINSSSNLFANFGGTFENNNQLLITSGTVSNIFGGNFNNNNGGYIEISSGATFQNDATFTGADGSLLYMTGGTFNNTSNLTHNNATAIL